MKLHDDFWTVTPDDRAQGLGRFIATGLVFAFGCFALYLAIVTAGAVR